MELKKWSEKLKFLRSIILKPDRFDEAVSLCLELHTMVHSSKMSGISITTFEDELWNGADEKTIREAINEKGRTIAYGMWHSSRIEDITMNILVNTDRQVINSLNYLKRINSPITDTGNELTKSEILKFSSQINIEELKNYRDDVGRKTQEIIKNLKPSDMKRKMDKERLKRILDEKAVSKDESAVWLIDFWGRKNVAGIILMPALRHHVIHINESFRAKKKGKM